MDTMENRHPAVGQIVIAETLMEQFYEVNASLGKGVESQGEEGASVYIAEGNRVYPGIWEHLDQARALLRADGSECDGYDALRSSVDTFTGIFDFQHQETKASLTGGQVAVFAWKINEEGIDSALQACELLKGQLPSVDWDEVHRAAEADVVDLSTGTSDALKLAAIACAGIVAIVVIWLIVK